MREKYINQMLKDITSIKGSLWNERKYRKKRKELECMSNEVLEREMKKIIHWLEVTK